MATENPPVNGMYGNQYNQPAELAASTPSAAATQSQTTSSTSSTPKTDPQEIGWYFVEQYYTTLSKTPEKIHLFYSKKSQLVTGQEAEKVVPCVGTKAISDKVKALDIQDCKVRVLNVDSQFSFQNIVVQVIGEMSNKSEPHHKFVQTFVLAEQPNGYFVLNDIFRYLSDDVDEIVDEPSHSEIPGEEPATPVDPSVPEPTVEEEVVTEQAAKEVDNKLEELVPESSAKSATSTGIEETSKEEPTVEESAPAQATETSTETPAPEEPQRAATPAAAKETAPPTAEAQPVKKSWADMLGSKAAAIPALPIKPLTVATQPKQTRAPTAQPINTAKPPPAPASTEPAASSSPTSQSNGWQTAEKKTNRPQNKAAAEGTTLAYIKNVNEKVDARILKEVLEKFGELKHFDVSRQRNCAFVEFVDPASYTAAVAGNPHAVGTEQIYVEERRPRQGNFNTPNAPFARGTGAPRGRGNMQQRTGSRDNYPKDPAGRGTFQPRGGAPKTGTITPKGRPSQAPAS